MAQDGDCRCTQEETLGRMDEKINGINSRLAEVEAMHHSVTTLTHEVSKMSGLIEGFASSIETYTNEFRTILDETRKHSKDMVSKEEFEKLKNKVEIEEENWKIDTREVMQKQSQDLYTKIFAAISALGVLGFLVYIVVKAAGII